MTGDKIYYAIQCKFCGRWRSCMAKNVETYIFKCNTCNKSNKLKQKDIFGLTLKIHGPFDVNYIPSVVQKLNSK